jgi:general secretion pathway protein A
MYEAYWGLREPPFDNTPNPKFFYLSPEHEQALARLLYVVRARKGCALLTGEYGCGKTTVTRALLQRLEPERYEVGLLTPPGGPPEEFLREVLYQLGGDTPPAARRELVHRLQDLIWRQHEAGRDTVIVVDEAQGIDDDAVFEELRLLLNFQTDERFLVTLLLVGAPELARRVRRLRALDQRVAVRFHLTTLDETHTGAYIAHRLRLAGQTRPLFTPAAVKLIWEATRGIPREINTVCDLALLAGSAAGLREVDERAVRQVLDERGGPA